MIRRLLVSAIASGALLGALGCHHKCCSGSLDAPPRPFYPTPPGGSVVGPPAGGSTIPPTGLPTVPPVGPSAAPAVPAPAPSSGLPPPDPLFGTPREGNFRPAPAPATPPANGSRPAQEILLPDALPNGGASRSQYPAPNRGPTAGVLGGPVRSPGQTTEPPVSKGGAAPSPPRSGSPLAGLPGFTRVKDGVASGRKPTLDGLDALKQAGYRTVVYLHPAGADVTATRDVVEKKGLAFVGIETTPEKLPDALDQFNKAIGTRSARPVYVADDDGVRAGAVWYLHFRTVELQNDDAARIKARALGFTDQGPEATEFLLAVQRYLESR